MDRGSQNFQVLGSFLSFQDSKLFFQVSVHFQQSTDSQSNLLKFNQPAYNALTSSVS